MVGLASYAIEEGWDAVVLVMLNVLPDYRAGARGERCWMPCATKRQRRGLERIIVVTSNDDLPALALYQRYGFQITELIPGLIADDHGGEFPGFAGIPVRDEIRLAYQVGGA